MSNQKLLIYDSAKAAMDAINEKLSEGYSIVDSRVAGAANQYGVCSWRYVFVLGTPEKPVLRPPQ